MRFTRARKEEDMSGLARRILGTAAKADIREAERELMEVNPKLRERLLDEDTLVVVPGTVQGGGRGGHGGKEVAAALLSEAKRRVEDFREVLTQRLQGGQEEARRDLERLKGVDIRNRPALKKRISAAADRASARAERIKELRGFHQEVLGRVEKDLDGLLDTFREADERFEEERPTPAERVKPAGGRKEGGGSKAGRKAPSEAGGKRAASGKKSKQRRAK
jgi:hypothetical protein